LFVISVSAESAEHETGTSKTDGEIHWTDEIVKLLIETWSSFRSDFEKPKSRKIKVWNKVAENMTTARPDLTITGADCDRKWRNLVQTYRKVTDKKKRSGEGAVHWKFYSAMQEATKDTAAISPKPEVLVQSLSVSPTASEHAAAVAVGTASSPNVSQQSPTSESRPTASVGVQTPKKKKRTASDEPPAWFLTYMEGKKAENERRWEAAQEMEKEKISVLKELIAALAKKD